MKQSLFIFLFFCNFFPGYPLDGFMYRLILKDKGNPPFSTEQPEMFLSGKSIQRRLKQGLAVDSADLPIDRSYLEAIAGTGADIRAYSKWTKTVTVYISGLSPVSQLKNLPFVDTLYCVWKGALPQPAVFREEKYVFQNTGANSPDTYGAGFTQIALNNGHLLHAAGFQGAGMTVAVIDEGFIHADITDYFDFRRIKDVKSFSHELGDPLREGVGHGTAVISCMLPDRTGELTGAAPEADYYLLRSEVNGEEYPVEEDYWVAALEYADSIGADIVTSSLGYSEFDDSLMNHTHSLLDGKSVPISIAAGLAASRGMLLFNAAGNERNKPWEKIIFPGDAPNMLTVGAVNRDSTCAYFSSAGPAADGRIKPDLMAMGTSITVVDGGQIRSNGAGTSYATPVLAGLSACLWQALPELTAFEIIDLLRETANAFSQPDSLTGFGIADVYKAYTRNRTGLKPAGTEDAVYFHVNARENRLYLNFNRLQNSSQSVLDIYSGAGIRLLSVSNLSSPVDISSLPQGIYIARLQTGGKPVSVRKFIKM